MTDLGCSPPDQHFLSACVCVGVWVCECVCECMYVYVGVIEIFTNIHMHYTVITAISSLYQNSRHLPTFEVTMSKFDQEGNT